jgi:hypothetical protein
MHVFVCVCMCAWHQNEPLRPSKLLVPLHSAGAQPLRSAWGQLGSWCSRIAVPAFRFIPPCCRPAVCCCIHVTSAVRCMPLRAAALRPPRGCAPPSRRCMRCTYITFIPEHDHHVGGCAAAESVRCALVRASRVRVSGPGRGRRRRPAGCTLLVGGPSSRPAGQLYIGSWTGTLCQYAAAPPAACTVRSTARRRHGCAWRRKRRA